MQSFNDLFLKRPEVPEELKEIVKGQKLKSRNILNSIFFGWIIIQRQWGN